MRVKSVIVIKVIISSYLSRDIWKMAPSLSLFSFNGSGGGSRKGRIRSSPESGRENQSQKGNPDERANSFDSWLAD